MLDAGTTAIDSGMPPPETPPSGTFVDVTESAGLGYAQAPARDPDADAGVDWYDTHGLDGIGHFGSGGAAAGDYDGDGYPDIYVTRFGAPPILFRNLGDGTFADVTSQVGLSGDGFDTMGPLWADIDNDGDLDLYVTTYRAERYLLFINEGGTFTEAAVERGVALADGQIHQGFSAAAGDYDRDGYLDLHTCEWQYDLPAPPSPSHSRLFRNLGALAPGTFEDTTAAAGVALWNVFPVGDHAFSSDLSDLNADGWPDLVVASDFLTSRVFGNLGDGTFVDRTEHASFGTDENGMGLAIGAYDGDGLLDVFVTAIAWPGTPAGIGGNRLYRNQGNGTFADETDSAGVRNGRWGWGATFLDFDNDGDLDLSMTNGIGFPERIYIQFKDVPMRLWEHDGSGTMTEVAAERGLDDIGDGKGLLVLDYDLDGDLDVYVVNHVDGGRLYRNEIDQGHGYLRLKLIGRTSNRQGIGARVEVVREVGDAPLVQELRAGSNYLSQNEPVVHFGLGPGTEPLAEVRVIWPTPGERIVQIVRDVGRNQVLTIEEPAAD